MPILFFIYPHLKCTTISFAIMAAIGHHAKIGKVFLKNICYDETVATN